MAAPGFTAPLTSTSFLTSSPALSHTPRCPATASRSTIRMQERKFPFFRNPFAKKEPEPAATSAFMEPQPGDPGYKPGTKLPVTSDDKQTKKRGFDLLRQDILVNAPTIAGVGRQDAGSLTMKPTAGEPGYKPESYQTVKVSELGISPFSDDKNYVGVVGGIDAVKKAAIDAKKGKSASQIKKEVMKVETKKEEKEGFDLPDYLKPLPEDTPRKGMTWKNYSGR